MSAEHSITELIPALMDGESVACQAVWDQFFVKLCRVAQYKLSGMTRIADEEDVALSALASVCRRLKRGDYPEVSSRDELWRLLVAVTQRKALNLLRDEGRQKRGGGRVAGESVFCGIDSSSAGGIDFVASAEPSPEFVATMSETLERMFSALDEQERQVAALKLEGHTNEDIAGKLGRSVATVERKLKLIRSVWSSYEQEPQ
jgi:DNA-directed RNA polymerase specialized sigma24 family protein